MNKLNYKILQGRRVLIGDTEFNIEKIEERKESDGTAEYLINDKRIFQRFDIAIAVSLVENQIKIENQPKDLLSRFKRKFGLFFRFDKMNLENAVPDLKDTVYQSTIGFRRFNEKKCGIFFRARFGTRIIDFEFSFKHKDVYEKGDLPNPFIDYKKLF